MMDLMGKRKIMFTISIAIIVAGFIGYLVNGLNLDIQFQGGTVITIEMSDADSDASLVEEVIGAELNKKITVQKLATYNPVNNANKINLLNVKIASKEALTDIQMNNTIDILKTQFGAKENAQMDVQSVAPSIGQELMDNGVSAVILASILIILYIWIRFSVMSGLSAALFAVLALMHDAAIMLSVYTIFKVPINEAFVAAILTILGYSMNDTIIIYDRIRENSSRLVKVSIEELVNTSVVQTLARSINTVATVLVCVITIYIFASINNITSIKEFSLPLIVGLASGGYSSIFIASPLWMMWKKRHAMKRIRAKRY
jgi:preprotein translocase subunit SecF